MHKFPFGAKTNEPSNTWQCNYLKATKYFIYRVTESWRYITYTIKQISNF